MEVNYCEIIPNWEDEVGRVDVDIKVSNEVDISNAAEGKLPADKIRHVTAKAIVDTGATLLVLPDEIIAQLGVRVTRQAKSKFADGRTLVRNVHGPIKVEVEGRSAIVEAVSAPKGVPALLGQVPLEVLDLLVDSKGRKLILNPESPDPDIAMVEVY
jgi:predicted aspartyl protease